MRPTVVALLVTAACVAGCARDRPGLTEADRQACERFAARADKPGSKAYEAVVAECVHNILHPERGGG
jgi:hypothetical protein